MKKWLIYLLAGIMVVVILGVLVLRDQQTGESPLCFKDSDCVAYGPKLGGGPKCINKDLVHMQICMGPGGCDFLEDQACSCELFRCKDI